MSGYSWSIGPIGTHILWPVRLIRDCPHFTAIIKEFMSCFCERKELKQVKVFVKARNVKPCINQFERITLYCI